MSEQRPDADATPPLRSLDAHGHAPIAPQLIVRDPREALAALREHWPGEGDPWVFGYASLLWRPGFDPAESRRARLHGWHRAFRMRSRVNRGTEQLPGLVFALLSGGACSGSVLRLKAESAEAEIERLWAREMPTGVYDARVLTCHTAQGPVHALSFTLNRRSAACLLPMADEQMLQVLRTARGRSGMTLDYLVQTAQALRELGVRDREVERLMALARRHALV